MNLPGWSIAAASSQTFTTIRFLELLVSKTLLWFTAIVLLSTCVSIGQAEDAGGVPKGIGAEDWPWWRGPTRNGVAAPGQDIPLEWSETKNVTWKVAVPGRGHASPTIIGDRIFLPTADEKKEVQSVLCFDRSTGKKLWQTVIHQGNMDHAGHKKTTQASASIASDGKRLFVNFLNNKKIVTTALDFEGRQLWQSSVSKFVTHQGFGSSPAIYGSLVIVAADNKSGGAVSALSAETGDVVWTHARPKEPNYTSPAILRIHDQEQVLLAGCNLVSSFEPLTGKLLWEAEGSTTEVVGSIVTDGERVFAAGGYPKKHTMAMNADGTGDLAWENTTQTYVPTMLVVDDFLYTVTDGGVAICWRSSDGKEQWKARLGGTFNTSPILIDNKILSINQDGKAFIFSADPTEYKQLASSQLGDDVYATPVVCGDRIYLRVADQSDGGRQEWLVCLGK